MPVPDSYLLFMGFSLMVFGGVLVILYWTEREREEINNG